MLDKARKDDSESDLIRALSMFKCSRDQDIEYFIKNKAIEFIHKDICRVYLILNEEEFDKNNIAIEAYFTLSLKALCFDDNVSRETKRKITGFKDRRITEFVLIGQIGKNDCINVNEKNIKPEICLKEILNYAFEVILSINDLVPCKVALVECSETIHKRGLYEKEGFKLLQKDNEYYQYYKKL